MTDREVIVNNRRSLLVFAGRNGVRKACKAFGVSRTTFYKIKRQFIATGSLEPRVRRRPRMPNETGLSKKKILLNLVKKHPSWGLDRYVYAFKEQGISFSRGAVWKCLKRFGLNRRYRRLVYMESLNLAGQPITERNIRALKKEFNKIREGLWPGHVVAMDTFYVGHLKGVGRIYQLAGIDLCSRFGWAHLYTNKEQTSSTHFVEQCLIPKFFNNGIEIESALTDNGTEFTGSKFEQMLKDYDIIHYRIPNGKPMMNGYCERFQRTIHEEFYQIQFRKRFFNKLSELQEELNRYLVYYNFDRPHFGVDKSGAFPIDVLKSKNNVLQQRFKKL